MAHLTLDQLIALEDLAEHAGKAILADKARTSSVELKADDSPLTSADMASHCAILDGLAKLDPTVPVLSEESKALSYDERKSWTKYYLVDPLDGTKEFIKGKKEYTVNIALIEDGVPTVGVVYVPELGEMYSGADGLGAFESHFEALASLLVRALGWLIAIGDAREDNRLAVPAGPGEKRAE